MQGKSVSVATIWETIVLEAERESPLWAAALLPEDEREEVAVFSPDDRDAAILLGDYLYAHGLVRITAAGDVEAVERLAELLSQCAHLRAEGRGVEDGEAWASTVGSLADGGPADEARNHALALHSERVD